MFKTDVKEQKEDFEEKMKISRKIREFKENREAGREMRLSQIAEANEEHIEDK